jgi:hypothetical protein
MREVERPIQRIGRVLVTICLEVLGHRICGMIWFVKRMVAGPMGESVARMSENDVGVYVPGVYIFGKDMEVQVYSNAKQDRVVDRLGGL